MSCLDAPERGRRAALRMPRGLAIERQKRKHLDALRLQRVHPLKARL